MAGSAFIGKVRDDQLGEVFTHDIRAIGVRYTTEAATAGQETARCLILVTPDAQRTLNTFLGASATLGPDDIDEQEVASAAITFSEGYLWDAPSARDALVKAMDAARGAGRQVAFSLSDGFCVERHREDFLALVRATARHPVRQRGRDLLALRGRRLRHGGGTGRAATSSLAFLTRGAQGSVVIAGDERHVVPATPLERLVDTTGAGDLYAAGVLYGLTTGRDLATCARLGSVAAAEVISHIGARPEVSLAQLTEGQ